MLCNSKTKNLIYSEQLFGIRLEVKVIRNWAINCMTGGPGPMDPRMHYITHCFFHAYILP